MAIPLPSAEREEAILGQKIPHVFVKMIRHGLPAMTSISRGTKLRFRTAAVIDTLVPKTCQFHPLREQELAFLPLAKESKRRLNHCARQHVHQDTLASKEWGKYTKKRNMK